LENGHIVRDFERIVWAIELATLEELAQFIRATGHECMIGYTSDFDEPALTIGGGYWD